MGQNPLAFFTLNAKTNAAAPGYTGQQNELFVAQRHGANYEAAYAKAMGMAANTAGVTTTVGGATTYVGLCLSNPKANTKNLVLLHAGGTLTVAPAALTSAFLAVGFNATTDVTHTTPITPQEAFVGDTTDVLTGLVDSSATLPTAPVIVRPLAGATLATSGFAFNHAIEGGIILPPGAYAAIVTNIAGPAAGFWGSFLWEEVAQ